MTRFHKQEVLKKDSHDVSHQLSPSADQRDQELVTLHTEFLSFKTCEKCGTHYKVGKSLEQHMM